MNEPQTEPETCFYGGVGVEFDFMTGAKMLGLVPDWSRRLRGLKREAEIQAGEVDASSPEGIPMFCCGLRDLAEALGEAAPPLGPDGIDFTATVMLDVQGRAAYAFIPDSFAISEVDDETVIKDLPDPEEVAAFGVLGKVKLYVGSTGPWGSTLWRDRLVTAHFNRLVECQKAAEGHYPDVMTELLART